MEAQVEKMVSGLPYGRRVVETINSWNDSRLWFINHMVDRACIGKCFAYANYEPPAGQFRVRVKHGSPIVTDSVERSEERRVGKECRSRWWRERGKRKGGTTSEGI